MRNGLLCRRKRVEPGIDAIDSGYLLPTPTETGNMLCPYMQRWPAHRRMLYPTPTVQDAHNNGSPSQRARHCQPLNAVLGGPLNPRWVEWLMGWPDGWASCEPWATDKFQSWLRWHGAILQAGWGSGKSNNQQENKK